MTVLVDQLGRPNMGGFIEVEDMTANIAFPVYSTTIGWHTNESAYQSEPETAPVVAVSEVSMAQCRLALLKVGFLDDVELYIKSAPREAKIEWEFSTVVNRQAQLVLVIQNEFKWTDEYVDWLFNLASTL